MVSCHHSYLLTPVVPDIEKLYCELDTVRQGELMVSCHHSYLLTPEVPDIEKVY